MKKLKQKLVCYLCIIVLYASLVSAANILSLDFSIGIDNNVKMNSLSIIQREKESFGYDPSSQYRMELLNIDNAIIRTFYFSLVRHSDEDDDRTEFPVHFDVLFSKDVHSIRILYNEDIIFNTEIKEHLCNNDNICNFYESYDTCPADCPSGTEDGFCDALEDTICDPDCLYGSDIDCEEMKDFVGNTVEIKGNFLKEGIYLVLIISIALTAIYLTKRLPKTKKLSKLANFIKNQRAKGHSDERIRHHLIKSRVPKNIVDKALRTAPTKSKVSKAYKKLRKP